MNVNGKGAIGNLERYSFLVKQAWEAYQAGNVAEMASLLQQSWDFSPYLRAERFQTGFLDLGSCVHI